MMGISAGRRTKDPARPLKEATGKAPLYRNY